MTEGLKPVKVRHFKTTFRLYFTQGIINVEYLGKIGTTIAIAVETEICMTLSEQNSKHEIECVGSFTINI